MRNIKEILRLKSEGNLSIRQIAKACSCSHSTVLSILGRAKTVGVSHPVPPEMTDKQLEAFLYPPAITLESNSRALPDMQYIHDELKKTKGVTLQLLWQEYKENNPQGLMYSQFCEHYRQWRKQREVSMHIEHRAGEKMFVDWAGATVQIIDPETGEIEKAYLFLAVLGASSYTFALACRSMDLDQWISAHCLAFSYFGGVTSVVVPDNLKAGVTKTCYYEPTINRTYQELANHYNTVIIPTRVASPQDKPKVEVGVKIAESWILAALRNYQFLHIAELNEAIQVKLEELNNRPFQKLEGSRREVFLNIDQPALKPLPTTVYEFAEWKKAHVNIDYHVVFAKNLYSTPYQLIKQEVEVRATRNIIEIFHNGSRIASHQRSYRIGKYVTDPNHRPPHHQAYLEWTPERIVNWAGSIGPSTAKFVEQLLASKLHIEQGYRVCLGVIRLAESYPAERMEKASERAIACNAISYQNLKLILEKGLDKNAMNPASPPIIEHANIRGAKYFSNKGGLLC